MKTVQQVEKSREKTSVAKEHFCFTTSKQTDAQQVSEQVLPCKKDPSPPSSTFPLSPSPLFFFHFWRMTLYGMEYPFGQFGLFPGFGWNRVNFLSSSWYKAVFWIQDENNVDNTLMFQFLLSSACSKSRTFSAFHTALPAHRLGVHKRLGGDATKTADPNWTKGYSIPYDIILNTKTGGRWPRDGDWLGFGQ